MFGDRMRSRPSAERDFCSNGDRKLVVETPKMSLGVVLPPYQSYEENPSIYKGCYDLLASQFPACAARLMNLVESAVYAKNSVNQMFTACRIACLTAQRKGQTSEQQDMVVCAAAFRVHPPKNSQQAFLQIYFLATHDGWKRRGLARLLVSYLRQQAQREEHTAMTVCLNQSAKLAQTVWEHLGFGPASKKQLSPYEASCRMTNLNGCVVWATALAEDVEERLQHAQASCAKSLLLRESQHGSPAHNFHHSHQPGSNRGTEAGSHRRYTLDQRDSDARPKVKGEAVQEGMPGPGPGTAAGQREQGLGETAGPSCGAAKAQGGAAGKLKGSGLGRKAGPGPKRVQVGRAGQRVGPGAASRAARLQSKAVKCGAVLLGAVKQLQQVADALLSPMLFPPRSPAPQEQQASGARKAPQDEHEKQLVLRASLLGLAASELLYGLDAQWQSNLEQLFGAALGAGKGAGGAGAAVAGLCGKRPRGGDEDAALLLPTVRSKDLLRQLGPLEAVAGQVVEQRVRAEAAVADAAGAGEVLEWHKRLRPLLQLNKRMLGNWEPRLAWQMGLRAQAEGQGQGQETQQGGQQSLQQQEEAAPQANMHQHQPEPPQQQHAPSAAATPSASHQAQGAGSGEGTSAKRPRTEVAGDPVPNPAGSHVTNPMTNSMTNISRVKLERVEEAAAGPMPSVPGAQSMEPRILDVPSMPAASASTTATEQRRWSMLHASTSGAGTPAYASAPATPALAGATGIAAAPVGVPSSSAQFARAAMALHPAGALVSGPGAGSCSGDGGSSLAGSAGKPGGVTRHVGSTSAGHNAEGQAYQQ